MTTLLLGINHNTASISIRERVAFAPEIMLDALQQSCVEAGLSEIVILSTCNRTELYCIPVRDVNTDDEKQQVQQRVLKWLAAFHRIDLNDLSGCIYSHWNHDAIRHLMQVASGLDSMVLGEPQILGQIKSAYIVAKEGGSVGSNLHRVFEDTFSTAKQVRTDTAIGENPVSIAFAAVSLAQQIFTNLSETSALLIGAGRTIELVVQHLQEAGIGKIVVANRTLKNALELKKKFGVNLILLADIPEQLIETDIVVSSTASQLPILGKGAVESALHARKHRPIFMVDIAVPRDIEPEVGDLEDVFLYSVDDLKQVIDSNMKGRQDAAIEAKEIIERSLELYQQKERSLGAVSTLRSFRQKSEQIRDAELEKALKLLEKGESPEQVLTAMARLLTNKLIHSPSVQMKKASADGRNELIQLAQELFDLEASNETVAATDIDDEKNTQT